jgi:acetoin utilization protein AcuB
MTPAPVTSWMSSPVHTVAPDTLAADAVTLLRRHAIRHLPVLERGHVVGVVTDRDLRGTAGDTPIRAIMSHPVTVVEDGRLVGILTQTDAVAALVAVVRLQVGGRPAEVAVEFRPDAMALAQQALRACGPEIARLVAATREPFAPGQRPERVRLQIETREMPRVLGALRAAGLAVLGGLGDDRA